MGGSRRHQRVVNRPAGDSGLGQSAQHLSRGFLLEEPAVREIGGEEPTDSRRSSTGESGQAGQYRERFEGSMAGQTDSHAVDGGQYRGALFVIGDAERNRHAGVDQ